MGKYFKYAIGEILLVVIGILIAIWLNGTYNDYKEKQVEKTILKKLVSDIESDYKQLLRADSINKLYLNSITAFIETLTENNDVVLKTKIGEGYGGAQFLSINPRSTTFDEMINSGKLYTLSNSSLTNRCIDYYELLDKYSYSLEQMRSEYRALFFGPQMTDYWLIYLEETKDKEKYIDAFVDNKKSTAYKTLKQCTGWGEMIMLDIVENIEEIKVYNRTLYTQLLMEIDKESND